MTCYFDYGRHACYCINSVFKAQPNIPENNLVCCDCITSWLLIWSMHSEQLFTKYQLLNRTLVLSKIWYGVYRRGIILHDTPVDCQDLPIARIQELLSVATYQEILPQLASPVVGVITLENIPDHFQIILVKMKPHLLMYTASDSNYIILEFKLLIFTL